jgi:ABC-2 type transport system permease protein
MTTTAAPLTDHRILPPGAVRNGGPLGLLALMVRINVRAGLRSPEFAIGVIAVPVLLYAMFGLPPADELLPAGTRAGTMMMVSLTAYGITSLAIFAFGDEVAKERGRGWTRTLEATPVPMWVHLASKLVMATAYALLITLAVAAVGVTAGGVRLSATTWLGYSVTMVGGVIAFSTLGFAIAYLAKPRTAAVIANLVFLPLSFLSGFFFPLSQLPEFLQDVAPWLPTYHFGQLAWSRVAPIGDAETFTGLASPGVGVHLVAVVGTTLAFGVVALLAARREAVTRRG